MYIGSSSTSQNRKNRMKSSDANTPSTPVSSTSIQAKYSFDRSVMLQEISTDSSVRKVVSSTSVMLIPSMPTRYCSLNAPMSGDSQSARLMNWNPPSGSKPISSAIESANAASVNNAPIRRGSSGRSRGSSAMIAAPSSGRNTRI